MIATHRPPIRSSHVQFLFQAHFIRLHQNPLCARFAWRMMSSKPSSEQLRALKQYTACDISDALVRLKVPNCGFLPDMSLYSPASTSSNSQITIAPASTVLMVPKTAADLSAYPIANIPEGKHWVDLTEAETFVVISQPKGQICAALGGIMALRMKMLNAAGVVAHGRVRDVDELRETKLPVRVFHPEPYPPLCLIFPLALTILSLP